MEETLWALQEENKALKEEHASLKTQVLSSANGLKLVRKSLNDLEQYTRRDCVEIRGIPLPEVSQRYSRGILHNIKSNVTTFLTTKF